MSPQFQAISKPAAGIPSSGIDCEASKPIPTDSLTSEPGSKTQLLDDPSAPAETAQSDPKPSWVNILTGSSGKMEKKGEPFVLDSGEICVKIPNEVISRNQKRWEAFIIGQFHGNLPSPGALHGILNGIWSNRLRDITISKLGLRTVLIRIPSPATRERVLSQGMWHIEGQTMFVAAWEPGLNPALPELTEAPVWLEFRGVPPHFFSEEGFEHIAGMIGHPIHCHSSTINMTNLEVGKVLTVINPSEPLPEAVNVQFATGEIHRITVSSPWLPPICSHCQELGHSIKRCPTAPVTCLGCQSTAHPTESCPRAKKIAEKEATASPAVNNLKEKTTKRRNNSSSKTSVWIEKPTTKKQKEPAQPQVEVGSHSNSAKKVSSKSRESLNSKTSKGKATAISSSSSSESDVDSKEEISSESSSEEESLSSEEEVVFTRVLSKKQRRQERILSGKSPKPKNH